jgi:iron complex transport system substrate-binding protein
VRVISLLPAATEIVASLGMLDALLGVSHECDYPEEGEPHARRTEGSTLKRKADPAAFRDRLQILALPQEVYRSARCVAP